MSSKRPHRRRRFNLLRGIWEGFLDHVQRRPLVTFFLAIVIILSGASALLELLEPGTFGLWRSFDYLFSGLDVDPPTTLSGRAVAAAVLIVGVFLVSVLTGYIASEFARLLDSAHSVRRKRPNEVFEDHTIILGWSAKTKEILRELDASFAATQSDGKPIVVVSPEERLDRGDEIIYDSVWHVRGNIEDRDVLRAADLTPHRGRGARVAAIVGDTTLSHDEADRRSLLNLLAVEHLHPDVFSIADIFEDKSRQHFMNANADEVLSASHYATMLLARAAEYPGVAGYVDELLALAPEYDSDRAPVSLYVRSAADLKVGGLSLGDAVSDCYDRRSLLIAGVVQGDSAVLLPDDDITRILRPEELMVIVARGASL